VEAPVGAMMKQMVLMLGLPVAIGMTLRHLKPALGQRIEGSCTRIASVLFILIVIAAVAKNWVLLRDNFHTLAPFAMALNVTMLACGFGVAWLARLSRQQSVTLGIETAIQNGTLAMVIGSSVLKQDAFALPGALYGVLMYISGLAFAYAMRAAVNRVRAGAPVTVPGAGSQG
jgi:bile acid:Na+ symporter, BASS family